MWVFISTFDFPPSPIAQSSFLPRGTACNPLMENRPESAKNEEKVQQLLTTFPITKPQMENGADNENMGRKWKKSEEKVQKIRSKCNNFFVYQTTNDCSDSDLFQIGIS